MWEIETPFLESTHEISHALGFRAEGIIRKNLRQTHLLVLESFPERQKATGVHYRYTDADSSDYGPSFYHVGNGAGKCHCGILPLAHSP